MATPISSTSPTTSSGRSRCASPNRKALLLAGSLATAFGLWKRGRLGWPIAGAGGWLITRALTTSVPRNLSVAVSQTINRSPEEVYGFFTDAAHWPLFMKGVQSAQQSEQTLSWRMESGSQGRSEITENIPQRRFCWTTTVNGISYDCVVHFREAPGNRGTEVYWFLMAPSARTAITEGFKSAFGNSIEQMARESIRRLKQLLETGEIATTVGQSHGPRGLKGKASRVLLRETPAEDKKRPPRHTGLPTQQIVAS